MSEQKRRDSDARVKLIAAWAGVAFTAFAVVGFIAAPGARIVWVVLLVFGVATIPQVLLRRHSPSDQAATVRRRSR
jgi:hypothetical protein